MAESNAAEAAGRVTLGRITSVYGVRGWVRVYSHTDPLDNILTYSPWMLVGQDSCRTLELIQGRRHGKGLIARLQGCESRDQAAPLCGLEVQVPVAALAPLADGEYYWHQLQGLRVDTLGGDCLGQVDHLLATGANDVLVVKATATSRDGRERLIPYLPGQVVETVNVTEGCIRVDWDPDF